METNMAAQLINNRGNIGVAVSGGVVTIDGDIFCSSQDQLEIEKFDVPRLIKTFKGREKQIEELDSLLFTQNKRKVVVCGLPGYGKTELTKQYVNHCVENNKIHRAFWVKAGNQNDFHNSSITLRKIYKEFEGQICLFIFDSAISRQETFDYEPPENDSFILLITSIETDWGDDVEPLKLEPLPPESVVDVYQSILNDNYQEEDRKLYEQLADVIGNVPLGLQVTGAYVRQQKKRLGRRFNLEAYIQALKQSQKKIVNANLPPGTANTYQKSMYGALKISLEKIINEEDIELKELALNILYLCCYLHPQYLYFKDVFKMSNSIEILTRNSHDQNQFKNALGLLENFCFVNFDPDEEELGMHRYTQDILRFHVSEFDSLMQFKCYGVCLQYVFDNTEHFHLAQFEKVLTHAEDNVASVQKYCEKQEHFLRNEFTNKNIFDCLAETGCIQSLKKIFDESGETLTKEYIDENYLLHKAVRKNQLETMKLLIQYGGDVDNKTFLQDTPLHLAVSMWNLDAIQILIGHGADLKARNCDGEIPLFSLFRDITLDSDEFEKALDQSLLDPALMLLFEMNSKKFNVKNQFVPRSSYIKSSKYRNLNVIIDILDLLECKDFKNTTNNNEETLLHIVTATCNEEMVNLLINRYNMDVDKQDLAGKTPVYSFISRSVEQDFLLDVSIEKAIATVKILIIHGAKLDIKDINGKTVIEFIEELKENNIFVHALCDNRCIEALKKVLDYLGEERAKNYIANTNIIHIAVHLKQLDILNLLLEYNVNINEMDITPLHIASFCWNIEAIRILLDHGADLNVKDVKGEIPLFSFINGATTRDDINFKTAIEILDMLKFEDYKHVTDNEGRTLLHVSAAACQEELVTLFVSKYKMKTNVKDKAGFTPLQTVLSNLGCPEVKKETILRIAKILRNSDNKYYYYYLFLSVSLLIIFLIDL